MTAELAGRVALVTGAAQGIGAAVARALAGQGAVVAAVDRDLVDAPYHRGPAPDASASAAHTVGSAAHTVGSAAHALGSAVHAFGLDVRDAGAVDATVARVERELGPIDILVNVAGVLRTGPVLGCTDEDWSEVFDVNAGGVFRVCRAVARVMVPRRSGVIVTVGSNAGGVPRMGMAAYAAAKAASSHFTRCLGLELAGHGIRCNVVAPGSTDTAMLRSMWTVGSGADAVIAGSPELYKVGIPLGRLAQPDDIADAVAFLASDRARHITMQELYVDGGAALHP